MRVQAASFLATVTVALFVVPSQAQVGGFSDIPANHWAAESVRKLTAMQVLQAPSKPAASKFDGNKPVTRYELAGALYRLVQALDKANQQKKSKMGADTTGADAVKYLVENGYLPKGTPLSKEGAKLVTANQLADSLSAVMIRLTEKSIPITPGSKYSND